MPTQQLNSDFLRYLASRETQDGESCRLPPLTELSDELGLGVSRLREQLEVAKALGLVEVRPRTGIRRLPFTFLPAVRQSLAYAIEMDRSYFDQFSDLRNHVESAYWRKAVSLLTPEDVGQLKELVARAWEKLQGPRIQIPHNEHRQFHMGTFKRLENPFVTGIQEAYWEAYEAVGLNLYTDYDYQQKVWVYHQRMVDAIESGDYQAGYQALVEHKDLIYHRPVSLLMENGKQA
jgi:DNA-binding FadR family transcriptional regulator